MKIIQTADKSQTLFSSKFNEHYHSINGAVNESVHIFLNAGFDYLNKQDIKILEVGFGTGLNAFLTITHVKQKSIKVHYDAIELYPVDMETVKQLNYTQILNFDNEIFLDLHKLSWNKTHKINDNFTINKIHNSLISTSLTNKYDLIYFDAFSPETQPEMWTTEVFTKLYNNMNNAGVLTTYSSKGIVKRALRDSGFLVKRLPGPKGKRHILRAIKNIESTPKSQNKCK